MRYVPNVTALIGLPQIAYPSHAAFCSGSWTLRRRDIDRAGIDPALAIARPQCEVVDERGDARADDRTDPVDPMTRPERRLPRLKRRERPDQRRPEAALRVHAGAGDRTDGQDVGRDGQTDGE